MNNEFLIHKQTIQIGTSSGESLAISNRWFNLKVKLNAAALPISIRWFKEVILWLITFFPRIYI